MSLLRQPNRDDYPEAASKHLQDAFALFDEKRFDGAAYLSGYVVECVLKAVIQAHAGADKVPRSHDMVRLLDMAGVLAVQADARTAGFHVVAERCLQTEPGILDWRPEMRYRGPETDSGTAESWLRDASDVYRQIIGGLVLEGAI